jgi:hypothetical protein
MPEYKKIGKVVAKKLKKGDTVYVKSGSKAMPGIVNDYEESTVDHYDAEGLHVKMRGFMPVIINFPPKAPFKWLAYTKTSEGGGKTRKAGKKLRLTRRR